MSTFGSPGSLPLTKPTPPQRGSFPLDHDGECKHVMQTYLDCIRKGRGTNESGCRDLAKTYLACRMDRNLMARDDFKNLGFNPEDSSSSASQTTSIGKPGGQQAKSSPEEAKPGELRW